MPKFFIANSTKQHCDFRYRLPEVAKIQQILIPYGTQVSLQQEDLSPEAIQCIIDQHRGITNEYFVQSSAVDRTTGHIGLIYSIGKPIDAELIANVISENDTELNTSAKQFRKEATIAADKQLSDADIPSNKSSSEIVEEIKPGINFDNAIAQGVSVRKERN